MRRKLGGSLAALLLAVIGTIVLVGYVQSAKDRAVAGERMVDVLVVTEPVAEGTAVEDIKDSVEVEKVPAKVKADEAVAALSELDEEFVTLVDLVPGEQVVASRFASASAASGGRGNSDQLTVTVSLEPERALGGLIRPGDTVAVLASFEPFDVTGAIGPDGQPLPEGTQSPNSTNLILHKVEVTAVQVDEQSEDAVSSGDDVSTSDEGDEGASAAPTTNLLVSLAVEGPAVERIVFAAEHGTVWLAAEPDGANEEGTKIVTRGNVYE